MAGAWLRAPRISINLAILLLAGCAAGEDSGSHSAEPTRVMVLADRNQDHVVTLEEWDQRADELYSEIDQGQDGQIDARELQGAFEVFDQDDNGVLDAREAPTVIDLADLDGDGFVSRVEFDSADWNEYPIDRNKDGFVNSREFRQGRRESFRSFDDDRDDRLNATGIDSSTRFTIMRF